MKALTFRQARQTLKQLGVTLRWTNLGDGELRVSVKGRPEAEAYYTNDLADAVGTGRFMAVEALPTTPQASRGVDLECAELMDNLPREGR